MIGGFIIKKLLENVFIKHISVTTLCVGILVAIAQGGIFFNQYQIAHNANKIAAYQYKMECYQKIVATNQQFFDISENSGSLNQDKNDDSQIEYNGFKGIIKKYTYPDRQKPFTVFFPEPSYINVLSQAPLTIGIESKFLFGDKNAKLINDWSNALCEYYTKLMVNSPYNNYKSQVDYRNDIKKITNLYNTIMNEKEIQDMLNISKY